jgi:hypothetical protein
MLWVPIFASVDGADPRFSKVTQFNSNAVSNYNGLVVSFRHRFTRGSNGLVQVNYTYSHALDESDIDFFTSGSSLYPQDPNNLRGAYGPAGYDVRHSLNANYVWELPLKAAFGGHGPDYLLKGWQISGTISARSGFPYTVLDNFESASLQQNNYFGQIYSVPVRPLPAGSSCGRAAAVVLDTNPCLPPQFSVITSPSPPILQNLPGTTNGQFPSPTGSV